MLKNINVENLLLFSIMFLISSLAVLVIAATQDVFTTILTIIAFLPFNVLMIMDIRKWKKWLKNSQTVLQTMQSIF